MTFELKNLSFSDLCLIRNTLRHEATKALKNSKLFSGNIKVAEIFYNDFQESFDLYKRVNQAVENN